MLLAGFHAGGQLGHDHHQEHEPRNSSQSSTGMRPLSGGVPSSVWPLAEARSEAPRFRGSDLSSGPRDPGTRPQPPKATTTHGFQEQLSRPEFEAGRAHVKCQPTPKQQHPHLIKSRDQTRHGRPSVRSTDAKNGQASFRCPAATPGAKPGFHSTQPAHAHPHHHKPHPSSWIREKPFDFPDLSILSRHHWPARFQAQFASGPLASWGIFSAPSGSRHWCQVSSGGKYSRCPPHGRVGNNRERFPSKRRLQTQGTRAVVGCSHKPVVPESKHARGQDAGKGSQK